MKIWKAENVSIVKFYFAMSFIEKYEELVTRILIDWKKKFWFDIKSTLFFF